MQLKHTGKSLPQIAAELNVDAIVEGSVGRAGSHVRVTAQLLDARRIVICGRPATNAR